MTNIRYRPSAELQKNAADFLALYHPSGEIPVPIEEIVEMLLAIEVVPISNLRSKHGVDGCISIDLQTVMVDEELMVKYHNRYRFTLAHEIGHRELHSGLIPARFARDLDEWKSQMQRFHPNCHRRLEAQAHIFAGFLLVPSAALKVALSDFKADGKLLNAQIISALAHRFVVSNEVMSRRIKCEDPLHCV